jgi:hypothetical protein
MQNKPKVNMVKIGKINLISDKKWFMKIIVIGHLVKTDPVRSELACTELVPKVQCRSVEPFSGITS